MIAPPEQPEGVIIVVALALVALLRYYKLGDRT